MPTAKGFKFFSNMNSRLLVEVNGQHAGELTNQLKHYADKVSRHYWGKQLMPGGGDESDVVEK